jgi:hypothetical protein
LPEPVLVMKNVMSDFAGCCAIDVQPAASKAIAAAPAIQGMRLIAFLLVGVSSADDPALRASVKQGSGARYSSHLPRRSAMNPEGARG